ncbi:MAG: BMP family protein, partial [Eubacteriales bacterium]|nr:BMP family protein [Eubacteriales bacterium]
AAIEEAMRNYASEEYDLVIGHGFEFGEPAMRVAPEFPDVKFFVSGKMPDGVTEADLPENAGFMDYREYEGAYLAGIVAGGMTESNIIGYVAGLEIPTQLSDLAGFVQGVKRINPDAKVYGVVTGTFEDPAKGKEAALALYDMGCDIVFAVAGKTGEGVFEAAAETGNYAIGVDSDQKYINPDLILCSMVKKVNKSIYDVVSDMDGKFQPGQIWSADMATGYIDVAYGTEDMPQQVSDELKAEVEELKEKIISGEIVVPSTLN